MNETAAETIIPAVPIAAAAATPLPPPEGPPIRTAALLQSRLKTLEQANNTWSIVTPLGTPFAAVLEEAYWANVARLFKMGDKIVVHTEDGTYYAELLVRAAFDRGARVAVLVHHDFDQVPDFGEIETHEVRLRGHAKWCVVRKHDSEAVKTHFESAEGARIWMNGHMRALAS